MEDLCTEDGGGLGRKDNNVGEGRRKGVLQGNSLNCYTTVRIKSRDSDELLTWLANGERVRVLLVAHQDGL